MPRLTPENKELHTSLMRQNICRTFAEMFAAQGDVSMEHLAEKMGIAKGTIYNYFEDKKALTAAVMEMRRKAMTALMEEKISPELPASEQLEIFVSIMWQDFNTHRHLRLEYLRNNPVQHLPHRPRPLDILKRIIEQGIAAGEFREFFDVIVNDKPVKTTAYEGAATVAVCLAAVESTKTGKVVQIKYPEK